MNFDLKMMDNKLFFFFFFLFFFNVQDCCPLFSNLWECVLTNKSMCHGGLVVLFHLQFMILVYEDLRSIEALSGNVPAKIFVG